MMSGWATTYTWRCDPIETSNSPQALRVSSTLRLSHTIVINDTITSWFCTFLVSCWCKLMFSSLDDPSCLAVLVLQDYWTYGHSKSSPFNLHNFFFSGNWLELINILFLLDVLCVEEKARPDHLPTHLPPFLHALDLVVGSWLCTWWVYHNKTLSVKEFFCFVFSYLILHISRPVQSAIMSLIWFQPCALQKPCACYLWSTEFCLVMRKWLTQSLCVKRVWLLHSWFPCKVRGSLALTQFDVCYYCPRWNGFFPCHGEFFRPRHHVFLLWPCSCWTTLPEVFVVEEIYDCHSTGMRNTFVQLWCSC